MPLDPLAAAFVAVEDNIEELAHKAAQLTEPAVLSVATEVADTVARQTAHEIATKAGTDALQAVEQATERLSGDVSAYLEAHPAEKGDKGDDGSSIKGDTGLNWRGAFVKGTVYQADDAVESGGSSYVASRPTKATPPNGPWELLAKKGRDGKDANSPMWFGGGGGGGAPSATVTDETTYGIVPAAGASTDYSRGDHTHGSPATPTAGAPTTADYLVGTAQAGLSAEIVVGTTPGGELGNTWASPTVDATHSGSSHAATQAAAESTAASALASHEADTTNVHGIANTANLYVAGGTDVAVADGGTGASTASGARTNLGLVIGTDVAAPLTYVTSVKWGVR